MAAIEKYCPDARNLLLIPEERPCGAAYWQNIAANADLSSDRFECAFRKSRRDIDRAAYDCFA